jgi:serine protease AprX
MEDRPTAPRARSVRVLVHVTVGEHATHADVLKAAQALEQSVPGFRVDHSYRPVSARPKPGVTRAVGRRAFVVRGHVPEDQLPALHQQTGAKPSRDARVHPFAVRSLAVDCATTGDPIGDTKLLVTKLGADRIWAAGYRGEGVVVGVVDAGIAARGRPLGVGEDEAIPHSPATGLVVGGWPDDWGTTARGWDQHGNMMAFDVQAVAPAAEIWDLRIWQPGGDYNACVSHAVSAYRTAIESYRETGVPQILTNSWGIYDPATDVYEADDLFTHLIEEALEAGILVLFAAGNCGAPCPYQQCGRDDTILGPNGHPGVMTVGAADLNDDLCGYSSRGPAALWPSARKPEFCSYTRFDGFFPSADWNLRDFDGGTSSATAVAAGVVALLKQKRPDLTQDDAKAVLMTTAENIWAPGFDRESGAGVIRAKAAFDAL